jgi:4-hydroxy-3-methylbut-2-enyl diphosphate reductase
MLFNVSTTGVESYHGDRAERILSLYSIEHREIDAGSIEIHADFLKKRPITIGITSGASTPDKYIAGHDLQEVTI